VLRIALEVVWLPCSVMASHRALDPVDDYLPMRRLRPRRPRLSRRSRDPIERFAAALREP